MAAKQFEIESRTRETEIISQVSYTEVSEMRQKNKDQNPARKRSYAKIVLICIEFAIVSIEIYLTISKIN